MASELEKVVAEMDEALGDSSAGDPITPLQIADWRDRLAAMGFAAGEPVGWMRRWAFNGETPRKDRNNQSGRLKLSPKFKFYPVTQARIFDDDVPLYALPPPPEGA